MRIDASIARVGTDWKATMSFEENLSIYFQENTVEEDVKNITYKMIEK
jgi:hypothetical protein